MKPIIKMFSAIILVLFLNSCTKPVFLDLEATEPKLVIEASLDWERGTTGNVQTIKLMLSTPYYNNNVVAANNAVVTVTDQGGAVYTFIQEPGTEKYICRNFSPAYSQLYTLKVVYQGDTYEASSSFQEATEVINVEQNNDVSIDDKQIGLRYKLKAMSADKDHFFFIRFSTEGIPYKDFTAFDDRLTKGQDMYALYSHKDIKVGSKVTAVVHSIDEQAYFYIVKIATNSNRVGNPFTTIPADVKGNIVNKTNNNKPPFGYFRASVTNQNIYVVK